jgi:hypothetical protein
MSDQALTPHHVLNFCLGRMKILLDTHGLSFITWAAYVELYKRRMINNDFLVDGLTRIHPILHNVALANLHDETMNAVNAVAFQPVLEKVEYLRLLIAIEIVFREPSGQESSELGERMFDTMLEKHKEIIEQLQANRLPMRTTMMPAIMPGPGPFGS